MKEYIDSLVGDKHITLDGEFTPEQLEAIVKFMRK